VSALLKTGVSEFRVLPNLNKTIGVFNGRESFHQAEDWKRAINGLVSLNGWPDILKFQFARANVQGAANDWYAGHVFTVWVDFEWQFRSTIARSINKSDRWNAMRNRPQRKDGCVAIYRSNSVKQKIMYCVGWTTRSWPCENLIIQKKGCYWTICLNHIGWTNCEQKIRDHTEYIYQNLCVTRKSWRFTVQLVSKQGLTWAWGVLIPTEPIMPMAETATAESTSVICWTCKWTGYLSWDCPSRRKVACFHCGIIGHLRPDCPE